MESADEQEEAFVLRTAPTQPQPLQQQQTSSLISSSTATTVSTQPPSSSPSSSTNAEQQQQLSTPPLSASALAGSALSVASGGGGGGHQLGTVVAEECSEEHVEGVKKAVRLPQAEYGAGGGAQQQSTPLRAVSLPPPTVMDKQFARSPPADRRLNYTQSERTPRDRPRFARSTSTRDAITHYIKRETANFFGVDEDTELEKQQRWLDRRKRLATRTYGPLKTDYALPPTRERYTSSPWDQHQARQPDGPSTSVPGPSSGQRPDVLPGPDTDDVTDIDGGTATQARQRRRNRVRRKDSVARMGWDGISFVVTTIARNKDRPRSSTQQWSRSFAPTADIGEVSPDSGVLPSTIAESRGSLVEERDREEEEEEEEMFFQRPAAPVSPAALPPIESGGLESVDYGTGEQGDVINTPRYTQETAGGWRRARHHKHRTQHSPAHIGVSRIPTPVLDGVLDNSNRRQYGMGWVGKVFGRSVKRHVIRDRHIKQQLDDMEDYRPMFTYWVTTVQILVLIISLICYGFGPFGLTLASRSGQALVNSLSVQEVEYTEPANFWIGPRAADLIHLGAKFAPCMRPDNKIMQQIEKTRAKERDTACCIRNDDSGCVQSSKTDCSTLISTWKKWSQGESGPGGRISGSVCGLDPKFCDAPASVHPYEWPDDITKWPICRKTNTQFSVQKRNSSYSSTALDTRDKLVAEHMVCEVIGHPCCIGIHGQCRITTQEYCDFVQGTFHDEASLCSQVSCLNNVCGMIPFYFVDAPDQIYRLWTSIFLHAGILQLLFTLLIQYFLMRDLEKLTGSLRIAIIYMGSGIAGNLASAIFVPYRADVGPAGCQFGLLACLIVEVLNAWPMLRRPTRALSKLIAITLALFIIGLLPWVDNYAHLFGFVFGFLISYALLPFVSFGPYDRQKKIVLIWVCLLSAVFLFVCLILLFYIIPVYDCKLCGYFNCLPFTQDFCASQDINFRREEPAV